jgi:uracil-DNA glycosylase family 4
MQKPETCSTCPLYEKGQGFVPDAVVARPDYIFVGEAPGKNEVIKAEPFVGQAGYVLKQWLMRAVPPIQVAYERQKITFMNILRCLPPESAGRAYPRGDDKARAEACCRQYDHLDQSAHTVVLFGETPQRHYFGTELATEDASDRHLGRDVKGVLGRVGRVYERDGQRWVFAPHPAWILRQPALVEHGQQALRIATGAETIVQVEYQSWEQAMRVL